MARLRLVQGERASALHTQSFRISAMSEQVPSVIEELIASKRYNEALRLANDEVKRHPGDHRLLNLCADIFLLLRKEDAAAKVLRHVADLHAATGSPAKAVVALKKIQRIGRDDPTMYESIASRIEQERSEGPSAPREPLPLPVDEELVRLTVELPIPPVGEIRAVEENAVLEDGVPSPLFDDFSRGELLAFIKGLQLQIFDAGDIIVAQDDPGHSLFILTSGIVKAFVRDRDHRHQKVRTLHDGDFFGEISILSGGRRSATVTAATRCELLELDRPTLDAIIRAHPHVSEVMRRFRDERLASDRSLDRS